MDPEQQRLRDHQEISNLLGRYARGLDAHDWDAVTACFEPSAAFVHPGGVQEGADAIVDRARNALTPLTASQHLLGTIVIDVDGDTAHASRPTSRPNTCGRGHPAAPRSSSPAPTTTISSGEVTAGGSASGASPTPGGTATLTSCGDHRHLVPEIAAARPRVVGRAHSGS